MNKLVLTFTSILTFWLLCFKGTDCVPVLPKPINATRKILQSPALTTAAVVATTPATVTQRTTTSQPVGNKPSDSIHPEKLPSSISQLSRPESLLQSTSFTSKEDRDVLSATNSREVNVNVVVSTIVFICLKENTIVKPITSFNVFFAPFRWGFFTSLVTWKAGRILIRKPCTEKKP